MKALEVEFYFFLVCAFQLFFDFNGLVVQFYLLVFDQSFHLLRQHAPVSFQLVKVIRQPPSQVGVLDLAPLEVVVVHGLHWKEETVLVGLELLALFHDWLRDHS